MVRLLFLVILVACCAPFGANSVRAAARPAKISPTVYRIVELVNVQRASRNLTLVKVNPLLVMEAQRFSGVQARLGRLSHRGVDGSNAGQRLTRAGYRWRFFGENLAAGQQTPEALVSAWMKSPSHRANVLHPRAREIGIGHTWKSGDQARYFDYWTMVVGQPR